MKYILLVLIVFFGGCSHRYLMTKEQANTLSVLNDAYKSQDYSKVIHCHGTDGKSKFDSITEWKMDNTE